MLTKDNEGIVNTIISPCTVECNIKNVGNVTIESITEYPFKNDVKIIV